jgi:hypothetical protein
MLEIGDSTDAFHAFPPDCPEWTEAVWFATYIPERALSAYVYQWFRPVLGIYGGGCIVWDRTARLPWDAPVFQYDVNRPVPGALNLANLVLDNGTSIRMEQAESVYDVHFANARVALDFRFMASSVPHITTREGEDAFFAGHLDQPGWCAGVLELEGERLVIAGYGVRDRSWGPRVIRDDVRMGYFHGGSRSTSFLGFCQTGVPGQTVVNGYLSMDGRQLPVRTGHREVAIAGDNLLKISFQIEDAAGRTLQATGTPLNEFAYMSYPNLLSRHYLMRWSVGAEVMYGEEQDLWSLPLWRRLRRESLGLD